MMMHIPARSRGSALAKADKSFLAQRVLLPVQRYFHTEITSGLVLLAATAAALVWANSPAADLYARFWTVNISIHFGAFSLSHTLREWINDALMVLFFFVVGLEIKREFVHGELSGWKRASLPIICAFGGMAIPAALYLAFNAGTENSHGWGIPMATDIAFSLGVLSLAGNRVPPAARIFVLAVATVDDIGAILVIAIFYTDHLTFIPLIWFVVLIAIILLMRRLGIHSAASYIPIGVLCWFAVLSSGVHATVAGVVLGLLTPTEPVREKLAFSDMAAALVGKIRDAVDRNDNNSAEGMLGRMEQLVADTEAPADRLVRILHPWSAYFVLPVFALANAGVTFNFSVLKTALFSPVTLGIFVGLFIGKCVGIAGFAFLASRFRAAKLMPELTWAHIAGLGMLGGIGFTISIFISDLAFTQQTVIDVAKIGVFAASVLSGVVGFVLLRVARPTTSSQTY
jgi:NhaA family Na+:H+ antiporter